MTTEWNQLEQPRILKARRLPKANTNTNNSQNDGSDSGFAVIQDKRLIVPFLELLDKAIMGKQHQVPKKNPTLKQKSPDVIATFDTVMHVWDIHLLHDVHAKARQTTVTKGKG
jgi:hypothetical protein